MNIEVFKKLGQYKSVCIITHISPDGDALGSSLALYILLKNMGTNCRILCADAIPRKYMFLPHVMDIALPEKDTAFECAVSVDCADVHLMGEAAEKFQAAGLQCCIDHHASNPHYAQEEILDIHASSSGELMYYLMKECSVEITNEMAVCLFTAISADTGNFSYSNTTQKTFLAASDLSTYDINIVDITSRIHKLRSVTFVKMLARVLKSLMLFVDGKLAIMYLSKKEIDELQDGITEYEGMIDFAREIEGVEAAAFLRETGDNNFKISLRSKPMLDVRYLAEKYSGGGHANAAGCQINGSLDEVIDRKSVV
jgi:bifunctional oligoribonuclease and PAP phosphatase NrnA